MLARSVGTRVLVSSASLRLPLLMPALRIHLQILDHLRGECPVGSDPVARLALEFACSCTRPHKRVRTQVALDVGRDDLSCDAVA